MGGLVARSACHYGAAARHDWLRQLGKLVFLGTPHQGAPLERGGNGWTCCSAISRYTAPFARLGKMRSAGITDLRYGNLVDEDWHGRDRFERSGRPRDARCRCRRACSATRSPRRPASAAGDLGDRLLGDGIVPLSSALGRHQDPRLALSFPESRQWIGYGMNHMQLLSRHEVYRQIVGWLGAPG